MAYDVETVERVARDLAAIVGLSDAGKEYLVNSYVAELSQRADHYHQRYPFAHESYLFYYDDAFCDSGLIWEFRFLVDGSHLAMGVVRVVYFDYETTPIP